LIDQLNAYFAAANTAVGSKRCLDGMKQPVICDRLIIEPFHVQIDTVVETHLASGKTWSMNSLYRILDRSTLSTPCHDTQNFTF
jgi:hypothetical protein